MASSGACAYCGQPSEGKFDVHRDGPFAGPEVPLCNACAASSGPGLHDIWERIAQPSDHPHAYRRLEDTDAE